MPMCECCGSMFMPDEMIRCHGDTPDGRHFVEMYCLSCVDVKLKDIMFAYVVRLRYGKHVRC
jgi:hypothetical protein